MFPEDRLIFVTQGPRYGSWSLSSELFHEHPLKLIPISSLMDWFNPSLPYPLCWNFLQQSGQCRPLLSCYSDRNTLASSRTRHNVIQHEVLSISSSRRALCWNWIWFIICAWNYNRCVLLFNETSIGNCHSYFRSRDR